MNRYATRCTNWQIWNEPANAESLVPPGLAGARWHGPLDEWTKIIYVPTAAQVQGLGVKTVLGAWAAGADNLWTRVLNRDLSPPPNGIPTKAKQVTDFVDMHYHNFDWYAGPEQVYQNAVVGGFCKGLWITEDGSEAASPQSIRNVDGHGNDVVSKQGPYYVPFSYFSKNLIWALQHNWNAADKYRSGHYDFAGFDWPGGIPSYHYVKKTDNLGGAVMGTNGFAMMTLMRRLMTGAAGDEVAIFPAGRITLTNMNAVPPAPAGRVINQAAVRTSKGILFLVGDTGNFAPGFPGEPEPPVGNLGKNPVMLQVTVPMIGFTRQKVNKVVRIDTVTGWRGFYTSPVFPNPTASVCDYLELGSPTVSGTNLVITLPMNDSNDPRPRQKYLWIGLEP